MAESKFRRKKVSHNHLQIPLCESVTRYRPLAATAIFAPVTQYPSIAGEKGHSAVNDIDVYGDLLRNGM